MMPDKETRARAARDRREVKAATTQAGEFVREEIHHVREGKHGARSTKQAIAIGLSKARRAGVALPVPAKGRASERTRAAARRALARGRHKRRTSRRRSRAVTRVLKHEGKRAASKRAVSRQAKSVARRRTVRQRTAAARKVARTRAR
jgi:hypothetical protein